MEANIIDISCCEMKMRDGHSAISLKCREVFHISTFYVEQKFFETTPSQETVDKLNPAMSFNRKNMSVLCQHFLTTSQDCLPVFGLCS